MRDRRWANEEPVSILRKQGRRREEQFRIQFEQMAKLYGFTLQYHTHRSDKSNPGFPDDTLFRPPSAMRRSRLIFVELKADDGKLSPEQEIWIAALREHPGCEVYVFRPSQWDMACEILSRD